MLSELLSECKAMIKIEINSPVLLAYLVVEQFVELHILWDTYIQSVKIKMVKELLLKRRILVFVCGAK